MSTIDLSGWNGGEPAKPKGKKAAWEWKPVEARFRGAVLAFDQSLGNTGWVLLDCGSGGKPLVRLVGHITPAANQAKSHEGTLLKAESIFPQIMQVIATAKQVGLQLRVAYETPPVGGKMMRPESSLLAALDVRLAARLQDVTDLHMVAAQSVKFRFTGQRDADKRVMHEVLYREHPGIRDLAPNNEHTRDALGIGLVAAEKE